MSISRLTALLQGAPSWVLPLSTQENPFAQAVTSLEHEDPAPPCLPRNSHGSYGVNYFRKLSPAEKEIREEKGSMDHQKHIL